MEYTRLGSTGLQVSRVCLGMMSYGAPSWRDWAHARAAAAPLVRRAVELGVTFFDTADMHSLGVGEEVTGSLLGELFADRDDYVLATKAGNRTREAKTTTGRGATTSPTVGVTKPGHIEDAVAAVGVALSGDEIAALEKPYVPHPVSGLEVQAIRLLPGHGGALR